MLIHPMPDPVAVHLGPVQVHWYGLMYVLAFALFIALGRVRIRQPHIAVLGRIAGTEHFRNIERYPAETQPELLVLRIDANLFFGNMEAVTARIECELATHQSARHLLLVMSAVNSIDTTALLALAELNQSLKRRGIGLHLAEVKGPVMDRLRNSTLLQQLNGKLFLSTANAFDQLHIAKDVA